MSGFSTKIPGASEKWTLAKSIHVECTELLHTLSIRLRNALGVQWFLF